MSACPGLKESDSYRRGWRWEQRLGTPGLGSSQTYHTVIPGQQGRGHITGEKMMLGFKVKSQVLPG